MIYLHIGRHKTGTTAIQHFLASNRERLMAQGIIYPPTQGPAWENAHHGVWMALRQRTSSLSQASARSPIDLHEFARHLRQAPNAIVSSEAFQELNPSDLVDVFSPDGTTVVVYLREQLDYLLTAYAQEIQSNLDARPFAEFVEDGAATLDLNYGRFLAAWADVFGEENLIVRVYDRDRLKNGSSVDDFMDALGFGSLAGFTHSGDDQNISLSAPLTVTKRLLNRAITLVEHGDWNLFDVFARLAESDASSQRRVSVSRTQRRVLRERYQPDNESISRQYFGATQDVFRYAPVHEIQLSFADSYLALMLTHLRELSPEAHDALIRAAENDSIASELSPEERRLAGQIQRMRQAGGA